MTATASRPHKPQIRSSYLHECLEPRKLRSVIKHAVKRLYLLRHEFDSIAFRGASGSLVAPAVAAKLDKHLILVRRGEACHSSCTIEGNVATESYVIIDDFVATGSTVGHIIQAIKDRQDKFDLPIGKPLLVLAYLEHVGCETHRDFYPYDNQVRIIGCKPSHDGY